MDLIYEGITTLTCRLFVLVPHVRMDLIYEGITTSSKYLSIFAMAVRMDLIYEGITTHWGCRCEPGSHRQNGPDLRRDYDQSMDSIGQYA